ncbi:putative rho guanyl nucleotide exchange [Diaporthe ampelina]|uniref:Putative rho guanyl nucleotide exchange n=1 Tax=Diaporthe ampelina TaxID=1214573 RepID=A0A0G2I3J5_9PEZI|nr:putative rho guanyl nucleotide exchange [Diaporthe ampelina]
MVIKELVDTEAVFVRDMNVIEEIYKGTAEACPQLDDKTIKLIFRNTDEIINFHTTFLGELKEGVTSVYVPKGRRSPVMKDDTTMSDATTIRSVASTTPSAVPSTAASSTTAVSLSGTTAMNGDTEDAKDRQTIIGPAFIRNIEQMKAAHEGFLRTSDVANKRLIDIQQDPTVKVWLNECNEVAKDLTAAWNLDSLLIKPMQRITKYPNLISQLLQYTPEDHPDREGLLTARTTVENAILDINKTKKNFELVGQIVGRKRKESDVKAGFARAFGKRVDKLQTSSNRPPEDPDYLKYNEKFSDDYLRLQVVLRDVEFYTRQVSTYVQAFLDYLSAIELVTRLQPGPYPELESKWVQFNVSMRDIKKVALDQHLLQIRKHVIEPFELVIRSYQNPLLAMKKRNKRRLDYEKSVQLKKSGKKLDKQLAELVEHYEALNDTLKKELPQLSALTEKVGNICLENMINIQAKWWLIWKEKIRAVASITDLPEVTEIVSTFNRDFRDMEEQILGLGILNPTRSSRASSRERYISKGYNVLWLAASLFEFNIETTKHEAGYPYLTYQAGEIFDVIAEKGELWLAKNQDDPSDLVGWIWSKHFAKLADS